MNPFHENPGRLPDQDELIAYHLHELSPRQGRALRRALKTNAALALESAAIAETLLAFPKNEPSLPFDAATLEHHWQVLRPSLAVHVPQPSAPRTLFRKWALPALAGSALAATTFFIALHNDHHTQPIATAIIESPTTRRQTPTDPAVSQPDLLAGVQPNAFNPNLQTTRSALPSDIPLEAVTPKTSPLFLSAESSTIPSPDKPASASAETSTTEAASTLPTITARTQPPSEPSTPASTRQGASPQKPVAHHLPPTELTLGISGNLTASRASTFTLGTGSAAIPETLAQSAPASVVTLASIRQQLNPWLGYRIAASYTDPTFTDSYTPSIATPNPSAYGNLIIYRRIDEFSATYVVQGPHHGRLTTSAEAGAAVLVIHSSDPGDTPSPTPTPCAPPPSSASARSSASPNTGACARSIAPCSTSPHPSLPSWTAQFPPAA
jgi:hypothetical protein